MRNILLIMCTLLTLASSTATRRISLNSADGDAEWKVARQIDLLGYTGQRISQSSFNFSNSIDAVVPGCTFTSWVEAGLVDNPEYGDNIYLVDETYYNRPMWYRCLFATPAHSEGQRVWLHFDNTNRFADFYLNGKKISGTASSVKDVSGHMIRTKFDITDQLAADGENVAAVLIYDPDQKKTRTSSDLYGVACSPSYLAGAGWDWMPYVPGRLAGITGNVYLQVTGDVVLEDPWVRSELPSMSIAEVKVSTRVRNVSQSTQTVSLRGTIEPGCIEFSKNITLNGGESRDVQFDNAEFQQLIIENPRLWWPNGYGEPNMYTCHIRCIAGDEVLDDKTVNFGIRKYEYRFPENSAGYPVMQLYVNGKRVYVKGGNWGMSEYLLRCHGEEYEKKIRLHKEMNYNMIRLWTGCVTDDEFYDYCDRYGMMVWDDFWLYVSFSAVAQPEAFKANALDKVRRLRNHPSIAVWCGANETTPPDDLNNYLRQLISEEDAGDRLYQPCSNKDGLSGSGWWTNQTPDRYFDSASNAMAFDGTNYPGYFTSNTGYGMRTEIGLATFPTYESVREFIPEDQQWPLPSDDVLRNEDFTVWNHHFFGKEGGNAGPVDYKNSVNNRYGESASLEEFCEKAQLLNIEDSKGMYESWNDKMWNDASGLLIWMSNPAYPAFVWQTYDYYYDFTGTYWGVKKACEHHHIQWNSLTNSVKVINTGGTDIDQAVAKATVYDIAGNEMSACSKQRVVTAPSSRSIEAFSLNLDAGEGDVSDVRFIRLTLTDRYGALLSENFYWTNGKEKYNYRALQNMPDAQVRVEVSDKSRLGEGIVLLTLINESTTVAFANRVRIVNSLTGERILPAIMSDNYITLMPGESKVITVEADVNAMQQGFDVMLKQYGCRERKVASSEVSGIEEMEIDGGEPKYKIISRRRSIEVVAQAWTTAQVRVHNLQGMEVARQPMQGRRASMELPAEGIYVVCVESAETAYTQKVIVK